MTRKNFNLIAKAMQTAYPYTPMQSKELAQWQVTCVRMADALETTNSAFDRKRFLGACWPSVQDGGKAA